MSGTKIFAALALATVFLLYKQRNTQALAQLLQNGSGNGTIPGGGVVTPGVFNTAAVWQAVGNRDLFESVYKSWPLIPMSGGSHYSTYMVNLPDTNRSIQFNVDKSPASTRYGKIFEIKFFDAQYPFADGGSWAKHVIWMAAYQDFRGLYAQPIINYYGIPPYSYSWPANIPDDRSYNEI